MGLKERKILSMLDEVAKEGWTALNTRLGTNFVLEFDHSAISEKIGDWNWDDADLKKLFAASYFGPVEYAMNEMFKDKMYKEAVIEQLAGFKIMAGRSGAADFDMEGRTVLFKHEMGVNQRDAGEAWNKSNGSSLISVLEKKLS